MSGFGGSGFFDIDFIMLSGKTVQTFAFPFGGFGVDFAIGAGPLRLFGGVGPGEGKFLYLWFIVEHSRFN